MRSKNNRIVTLGGILTLLTVVALQFGPARQQHVSSKTEAVSAKGNEQSVAHEEVTSGAVPAVSLNQSLFQYLATPANAAAIERQLPAPSHDVRYVKIDPQMTSAGSPLARVGNRVDFELPNGVHVPVVIEKTESLGDKTFVSDARVEGSDGFVTFSVNDGEMSASIDSLKLGAWQVRALGNAVSQVFQIDSSLVPPCAEDPAIHGSSATEPAPGSIDAAHLAGDLAEADSADFGPVFAPNTSATSTVQQTVRVLVPYSSKILSTTSSAAVASAVNLAVANLNGDLARSGIPVKVVLSETYAVTYSQDGTDPSNAAVTNALSRLASTTDGILDTVHLTRYNTQSDLVCLMISQYDSANSGVAYVLRNAGNALNPTYGFAVVTYGYLNAGRTFSHEIGHNFGCNHDRANAYSTTGAPPTGTYAYSYGYRFYGQNGAQYRTIMAYPPGQVAAYFSNPNLAAASPVGVAVGVPLSNTSSEAYNALTITQNAAEVANFHNSSLLKRIASRVH